MLSIELLPAAQGDSIWIEYGSAGRVHRMVIDGGPAPTYESGLRRRIAALQGQPCAFDLMVVTHIDTDHIDGAVILLQEYAAMQVRIHELWFNGWAQIAADQEAADPRAPLQGEFLDGLIEADPELRGAWNKRFAQRSVVIPASGPLPAVELAGGARLTLLGPTDAQLRRLRTNWASAITGFAPGDAAEALRRLRERHEYRPPAARAGATAPQFGDDRAVANGSSIACVFEYDGVSILLAGDAHARSLATSLRRLASERSVTKLPFDAVKLPHHGSMSNVSDAWLRWVNCDRWLISTNGSVFGHPDVETAQIIARHCQAPPTLLCNYRSTSTERLALQAGPGQWHTAFPTDKTTGPGGGLRLSW